MLSAKLPWLFSAFHESDKQIKGLTWDYEGIGRDDG